MNPLRPISTWAASPSRAPLTLALTLALVLSACRADRITSPDNLVAVRVPTSISVEPGSATLDALGATQSFAATIRDQNGAVISGLTVEWSTSQSGVAIITPSGVATAVSNGTTLVVARLGTLEGSATLTVQQVVTSLLKIAGDNQQGAPGAMLPNALRVATRDRLDNPVAGALVLFEVSTNGGSVSPPSATTNAAGEASTAWTLPNLPSTTHTVTAKVSTAPTLQVVFTGTVSAVAPAPPGFTIDLRFISEITATQLQAFNNAALRWQTIITGDLPNVLLNMGAGECGPGSPAFNEIIDDLVIFVSLEPIDDVGKVLGQAGPCRARSGTFLPSAGIMFFDIADIASLERNGLLEDVILHEMGHVLGIGTLWTLKGLLANPSLPSSPGVDTHFTGANAIAAFNSIGGLNYIGAKVPVENSQGGDGTRDGHWRESVFSNELMTGFLNSGSNPLSLVTIRSLQDLGYTVDASAADTYVLPLAGVRADALGSVHLLSDIARVPLRIGG